MLKLMNAFKATFLLIISVAILSSCYRTKYNNSDGSNSDASITSQQEEMTQDGWEFYTPPAGDLDPAYGVNAIYGLQDNYFDIVVGSDICIAIKIMSVDTDKCIRYVYVPGNQTTTINNIPQGIYYLKLAYGYDWMRKRGDSHILGKFSRGVSYERSLSAYNFGMKNSRSFINYTLKINVNDDSILNNFETTSIDELDFYAD